MRRFIARILRIPDRREEHLLETAMRTTSNPVPPAGLRDRLVADALAAADQAIPQRQRSHPWVAWAVPAAALVIVLAWLAFGNHGARHVDEKVTPQMAATQNAPAPPLPEPSKQEVVKEPVIENEPEVRQPAHQLKRVPKHRPKPLVVLKERPVEKQPEINTHDVPAPEQPVIVVKVGPRREGEVSYARAATRDENGVRTEWAIYSGRKPGEYREEMCVSDSDGRGFCLTTTSSNDPLDGLEETL